MPQAPGPWIAEMRTRPGGVVHRAGIQTSGFGLVPPWLALGEQIMAGAAGKNGQRNEDGGADEIPTNSARHAGDNARNSVKDCSMMRALDEAPWARQYSVNHERTGATFPGRSAARSKA